MSGRSHLSRRLSARRAPLSRYSHRLTVEQLESRLVPAVTFTQTNLVTDNQAILASLGFAPAAHTDANLVNPWGMTLGTNSGLWVSDNGTGMATTYDATGQSLQAAVTIPTPAGTGTSAPTGVVTNATTRFVISSGTKSGPSTELFATEDGTIAGWNSSVDATHAVIAVDNSASGAVYKGLALGFNEAGAFLFATNFHTGTIDVFDSNFQPVHIPGAFKDKDIPDGFAPFGISAINSHLYVTYAKINPNNPDDDLAGPGNGFIDIFDTEGKLLQKFTSQGQLNSPWGMAWAPFEGFGEFKNALFVGNFGDGTVNAFDFDSGDFLGKVKNAGGTTITIPGIWGLQFGLGLPNASSTLFFAAGIDDEQHGLFGTLKVNASSLPPPEGPEMLDPNLKVTTVVSGLDQPTSMTFLGANDFLVLEKASGKVQHVVGGALATPLQFVTPTGATLANLPVNNASERGLLGIALDPSFASNHFVYLYWTESSTGAVSSNLAQVGNPNSPFPPGTAQPLGNRVDRFVFNAQRNTLTFDRNLIELRAFQQDNTHAIDAGQPLRGNHDAGKILFGSDGKLYIQIGDNGRRGQLQNLASGPFGPGQTDDQFGGPAPDKAHVTGVIFRLNPDGTTPTDNPFSNVTAQQIAQLEQQAGVTLSTAQLNEVVANIHKIFSYGRRNGFGLAFDALTGSLWESENGDDAFDEMNLVTPGSNGGWVQIMGPANRIRDFKEIETSFTPLQGNLPVAGNLPFSAIDPATFIPALQQLRWPPSLIADTPGQARNRLFVLPGSHYDDPQFSWKWAVAPSAIGFAGSGLGPAHTGDLFVGAARTFLDGGYLFEFKFDKSRQHFAFSDPALADKVADNDYKFDEGESDSLIAGENFGIVTNIVTGPDGNLYLTSLSNGAIYMITQQRATTSMAFAVSRDDHRIEKNMFDTDGKALGDWTVTAPGQFTDVAAGSFGPNANPIAFGLKMDHQIFFARFDANGDLMNNWTLVAPGQFTALTVGAIGTSGSTPIVFGLGTNQQAYAAVFKADGTLDHGWFRVAPGNFTALASGQFGAAGNPELFGVGVNQQVYAARLDSNGNLINGFFQVAPGMFLSLTVASRGAGAQELFGVGFNHQAFAATLDANGNLAMGWFATASGQFSTLGALALSGGNVGVFALGTDQQIFTTTFSATTGAQLSDWRKPAPGLFSGFAAIVNSAGLVQLLGIDAFDGSIFSAVFDGNDMLISGFMTTASGAFDAVAIAPHT